MIKKLLILPVLCLLVFCPGIARSDLQPALNNSYSSDGDAYLLYRTYNSLFGNIASVGSNNELLSSNNYYVRYFNNQGPLQVTAPRIYAVSGVHDDDDTFTVWGPNNTEIGNLFSNYNFQNINPTNTQVLRDWLNRPLQLRPGIDLTNYSGPLNFSVTNQDGNGGVFNSNVIDYPNRVGYGSNLTLDTSGVNYFLYFDVTNLMALAYPDLPFEYTSAWLIAYEDRAMSGPRQTDYDYNDGVFLVFSNDGVGPPQPGVPEPATLLLWTLGSMGLAGGSWARKRRRMMKLMA